MLLQNLGDKQNLLEIKMAPRETKNNALQNLGDKQRALWYVIVFSGVVNYSKLKGNEL